MENWIINEEDCMGDNQGTLSNFRKEITEWFGQQNKREYGGLNELGGRKRQERSSPTSQ